MIALAFLFTGCFVAIWIFCKYNMRSHSSDLLFVLGSGGHTSEMLYMMQQMDFSLYKKIHVVHASTDLISRPKMMEFLGTNNSGFDPAKVNFIVIQRTNEVGDSKLVSIAKTLLALLQTSYKLARLTALRASYFNGPGVCIPVIAILYLRKVL